MDRKSQWIRIALVLIIEFFTFKVIAQDDTQSIINTQTQSHDFSQSSARHIRPISIGESIPNIEITVLNYPKRVCRLSDFKGKVLILDFWATWCGACISMFPKLDSLQTLFKEQLQIILVNSLNTKDNESQIARFIDKKLKNNSFLNIPTIINDSLLNDFFPHTGIPHYIWITADGYLSAITSSDQITAENIRKIINDNNIDLPEKKDYFQNKLMDLPGITVDNLSEYKLFKKGKLEDYNTVSKLRRSGDIIRGIAIKNVPLVDIYKKVISFNTEFSQVFDDKRFVIEVKDSSGLIFDSIKFDKEDWNRQNLYTFDFIAPLSEVKYLFNDMLELLNRCSDYKGKIQKKKVKCYVLIRTSKLDKIKTKGSKTEYKLYEGLPVKYANNIPIQTLVASLNKISSIDFPVIDQTNYSNRIDIEFTGDLSDFSNLQKNLQRYDLQLITKVKEIDVFVLADKSRK